MLKPDARLDRSRFTWPPPVGRWTRLGPAVFIATGAWVGFFPFAPGTAGAAWGLPLAWALTYLEPTARFVVLVTLFGVGIPICTAAARRLGKKDPGAVVWDEIVTMPLTFALVPPVGWKTVLVGFVLHRVFDITKVPPAKQLERLPGGLGIMADDVAAGAYAGATLYALHLANFV